MRRNVAIYGGSYDPPTLAHAMIASHVILNEEMIDEQLIVPAFMHLEKSGLTDYEDRVAMCEDNFGWLPRTTVSRIEQEMGGPSLSVRTIREVKRRDPNCHVYFVMGSDLLARAASWEGWDELIMESTPIIVGRAGMPSQRVGKDRELSPICPAISSTEVRTFLRAGEFERAFRNLSRGVRRIIEKRHLYGFK